MKKIFILILFIGSLNCAFAIESNNSNNNLYSVNYFATQIKRKYPEYKNINNVELVYIFVKKYPQNKELLFFTKDEQIQFLQYQNNDYRNQVKKLKEKLENQIIETILKESQNY